MTAPARPVAVDEVSVAGLPVAGLVVDLDGVLRFFDHDAVAVVEARHDLPAGVIWSTASDPALLGPALTGVLSDEAWRYRTALALAEMYGADTAAAAVTAWAAVPGRVDPDVRRLLAAAGAVVPLVLLTNATTRVEADLGALGLTGLFTAVVSSARTGAVKPDPAAFAAAARALTDATGAPVDPARIAYVDDDAANVDAADALGWTTHRFTDAPALAAWLGAIGVSLDADADADDPAAAAGADPITDTGAGAADRVGPVEPWTLLAERPGLSGRWLRVTTATYRLPRGELVEWDLVHEADAVAVLALTPAGDVVVARQYRPGPDTVLDEMPGGLLDPGESPAAAAARELLEETGYAGRVEVLGWAWQDGRATRRMWTAVATGCIRVAAPTEGAPSPDVADPGPSAGSAEPGPSADIEVVVVPAADFVARVRSGALTDVARAYRALDHLGLLAAR